MNIPLKFLLAVSFVLFAGQTVFLHAAELERRVFTGSCDEFVRYVKQTGVKDLDDGYHPGRAAVSEFVYSPRIGNLVIYPSEAPSTGYACGSERVQYSDRELCLRECAPRLKANDPLRCTPASRRVCYLARIDKRPALFKVDSKVILLDWFPSQPVSAECREEKQYWEEEVLARERDILLDHVRPALQKQNRIWNNRSPHIYEACADTAEEAKQRLVNDIQNDLKVKAEAIKAEAEASMAQALAEQAESPARLDCKLCRAERALAAPPSSTTD